MNNAAYGLEELTARVSPVTVFAIDCGEVP